MDFPSTLITGTDPDRIDTALVSLLNKLSTNLNPNNPDLFVIGSQTGWGIEVIREISDFLSRHPLKHQNKVVLIRDAHLLKTESQNALLKTLEEPPANCFLILITPSASALLPTIISRCHVIKTIPSPPAPSSLPPLEFNLDSASAIILSDTITQDKSAVLPYLENQLEAFRQQLLNRPDPQTASRISQILKSINMIKSNVDPKSALDYLLLG